PRELHPRRVVDEQDDGNEDDDQVERAERPRHQNRGDLLGDHPPFSGRSADGHACSPLSVEVGAVPPPGRAWATHPTSPLTTSFPRTHTKLWSRARPERPEHMTGPHPPQVSARACVGGSGSRE